MPRPTSLTRNYISSSRPTTAHPGFSEPTGTSDAFGAESAPEVLIGHLGYESAELAETAPPSTWSERLLERCRRIGRGTFKLGVVGLVFYALLFNFSVVRGNSMAPGIHDGDRILVNQLTLMFSEVERGAIVVLRYPLDPDVDYIKRVVGMPGDHVEIRFGEVWINGKKLEEPYIGVQDPYSQLVTDVLPDHYFVLGDNRLHSSDSREFGQVPQAYLRGRVDLRVWPIDRIGSVK